MPTVLKIATAPVIMLIIFVICLAIAPKRPAALAHIAAGFAEVDWSTLPALQTTPARDGVALAYRAYGDGTEVILALHGSGGSGAALHPLAHALTNPNRTVIVPDIRGHGSTGVRGDVSYINQTSDDIDDLLNIVAPGQTVTIVGFSMGGGLALKYAAARPERTGDVILLSPYLAYDAPPMAAQNPYAPTNVWAAPSVPRLATLGMLNGIGVTTFNHLPVVALATSQEDSETVVEAYTYRALASVNPDDWQADITKIGDRLTVMVGDLDELHAAPAYAEALKTAPTANLITLPGVDHMGLTLKPAAIEQVVATLEATR